jgi:hypothetical protein
MTARSPEPKPSRAAPRRRFVTPAMFWAAVAALAVVALANVTGRLVVEPDVAASPAGKDRELVVISTSQAGWPLPFVAVGGQRFFPLAALEEGVHWISWPALAADVAIGLVLAAAGGWLLAARFRGRRQLLQFGLFDVLLATGLIGLALGYGLLPRMEHLEDQRTVANLTPEVGSQTISTGRRRVVNVRRFIWQPGPTEWARQIVGEKRIPDTGRVVAANVRGGDVRRLARLDRLRVLRVYGTVTDDELNQLGKLTHLECLDLGQAVLRKDRGGWIDSAEGTTEFPLALARLKRLYAQGNSLQGGDLAGCTNLRELDLSQSTVDLPSATTIGGLRSLRILDLHETELDDRLLAELAGLSNLEMIDLSSTRVTDAGLVHLRGLPRLRSVWLADSAVSDRGLAELARFPALEAVRLRGSAVTRQGLAALALARPDCAIVP